MEGNILFNDALNTFYLRLYGKGPLSEKGNPHSLTCSCYLPLSYNTYKIHVTHLSPRCPDYRPDHSDLLPVGLGTNMIDRTSFDLLPVDVVTDIAIKLFSIVVNKL